MGDIIDPYSKLLLFTFSHCHIHLYLLGYFDRYKNMKILQIQTGGDEFFLPDNEVK